MQTEKQFLDFDEVSVPPAGSVNVWRGRKLVGTGGAWVPCVSQFRHQFFAGLYQVGPGQHQACLAKDPMSRHMAQRRAIELAELAAQ